MVRLVDLGRTVSDPSLPVLGSVRGPRHAAARRTLVAAVLGFLVGGYVGARTAVARGNGFVRGVFVVVVTVFVIRLGGTVVGLW